MSKAIVFHSRSQLQTRLLMERNHGNKIGFVPTMGALHEGHLALVRRAKEECQTVVVSIFVNPTQFNNASDLEKYPRTPEKDLELLSTLGEVLVFLPSIEEIYPAKDSFPGVDLGLLDKVLEGKFRPGHFQGVTHVVYNLFEIVQPDFAYFGKKDYQQVAVIRKMVKTLQLPVQIIACKTLREPSGLAMSSRNTRLPLEEKMEALLIVNTLKYVQRLAEKMTPSETAEEGRLFFGHDKLQLEYLEIINGENFEPLTNEWTQNAVCCIAAACGPVRLIDNLELFHDEIQ